MRFSQSLIRNKFNYTNCYFTGTIVGNEDPLGFNRVQVAVDGLTNELSSEDLPWYCLFTSPGSGNNAHSSIPQIGSNVLVRFLDNSVYNGLVEYSISQKPSS